MTKGTLALKLGGKKLPFTLKNHLSLGCVSCFFKRFFNLSSEQNLRWNWVIYCHALNILYLFFPLISFFSEVLGNIEITMNWLFLWILGKGTGLAVSEKMAGIGGGRPRMGRVEGKVSRPKNRRSTQKSTITDVNRGMVFASSRNQAKSNSLFQTRQGRKRPIYWLSRTVVSRFFPCLSYVILMTTPWNSCIYKSETETQSS